MSSLSADTRLGIIGSGAWATTLGVLAVQNGATARCLGRNADLMDEYNAAERNTTYLPSFALPMPQFAYSADPDEVLAEADAIVLAVPSEHVEGTCEQFSAYLGSSDTPMLSAIKGFVDDELTLVTDVLPKDIGEHPLAVISGPNLAREVMRGDPAVTIIASSSDDAIDYFRQYFSSPVFRIYGSHDVLGVQIAGAVKNTLAIAAGVVGAVGLGMNTQSALLARGLAEMTALVEELGGERSTALGIAGLGDAICTCLSPFSRNVQLGQAIGEGHSLELALQRVNGIPEGLPTTRHLYAYAKAHDFDLPITSAVYGVLKGELNPERAMNLLMQRAWKMEVL